MAGFGYSCALLLAAVFVLAGAAKLARPARTTAGFEALGVRAPAAAARVVPVAELALAVALSAAPRVGGVGALLMLVALSGRLARAVRAGVRAPCHCFGTARSDPVSNVDLVRNAMLGVLAVAAVATRRTGRPGLPGAIVALAAFAAGAAGLRALRRVTGS